VSLGLGARMALSKSKKCFGGITERTDPFRGTDFPLTQARPVLTIRWNGFAKESRDKTLCLGSALVCTRSALGEIPSVPEKGPNPF
jgi:hypothetical protein